MFKRKEKLKKNYKNKRKLFSMWLIICFIFAMLPLVPVSAATFVSGGLLYNVLTSGTVEVAQNNYTGTSYTIPSQVTNGGTTYNVVRIGERAFYYCSALETINVPSTVSSIGFAAFDNCYALKAINIPDNVTVIDHSVFRRCDSLTSLTMKNVISIGNTSIFYCANLTSVTVLSNLTNLGGLALARNPKLTTLKLTGVPPVSLFEDPFEDDPADRDLILVDSTGTPLTGTAFANASAAYRAVNDGNTTDNKWYGWNIVQPKSTNAGLASVAGQTDSTPGPQPGTKTSPIAWEISVLNSVSTLTTANIVRSDASSAVALYSDSNFSNATSSLALADGGTTTAYIKVTAEDTSVVKYYAVAISRAAAPKPGTLAFSSSEYSAAEDGTSAIITVDRTGGSDGSVSVKYATSNGTAAAGSDYAAASGTLTFANGQTSNTFTVDIIDDSVYEGDKTVNLTLSNAAGGATLGTPNTAVLTIIDNEPAKSVLAHNVPGNTKSFYSLMEGYGAGNRETLNVKITSTGTNSNVKVVLSGNDADCFTLSGDINTLGNGEAGTFTVASKVGLPAGTYNAMVTVTSDEFPEGVSFSVIQPVDAPGWFALTAVPGSRHVRLNWDAVPDALYYNIYRDGAYVDTVLDEYSYMVENLTNGTAYNFEIKAENDDHIVIAISDQAASTPAGLPEAPTGVTPIAGDGEVTVYFTPPVDDGGSPITGYVVTTSPGGITVSGTESPITVTELTNDVSYTFTVRAVNEIGESGESEPSNAVIPTAEPVLTAPGITSHPESRAVRIGQTATFAVTAAGSSPLFYQWKKDGVDIDGATSNILTINNVQVSDEGSYTCYVSNSAGNTTSNTAVLTVNEAESLVLTAVPGNQAVNLTWNNIPDAVYYNIYKDNLLIETVSGSAYTAAGLTNGITYNFEVKAMDADMNVIAASVQISATPATNPGMPTAVTAAAGNGQATVSFTPPSDNGGSPITGYIVIANPGGITAGGTGTSITITGLTNGTDYSFIVKAINSVGMSAGSAPSNAARPYSPSSGNGGNSSPSTPSGGGGGSSSPSVPSKPDSGVDILVNGKVENAGTANTTTQGSQKVTTIMVDSQKLQQKLDEEGDHAVVTIPVNTKADVVIGELNAQMVRNMENRQAVLEVKTETAAYTLPAQQINVNFISEQMGRDVALQDIKVQIAITQSSPETVKIAENSAQKGSFAIVAPPVDFWIKGSYGGRTVEVSKFNAFVERTLAIPEGVDPNKITTGIVMDPDGAVRHVPTQVTVIDGKYYAKINSLTNSTYSVVWHPLEFKDAAGHWAEEAINDMGSRMVISGVGNGIFQPDRDITRAEFTAIVVTALGLKPGMGTVSFNDVQDYDWYSGYIKTAFEYNLISGYNAEKFGPKDSITREQAMAIIARAMKITPLKVELDGGEVQKLLGAYLDGERTAVYAKDGIAACIKAGVVQGRNGNILDPKKNITRAEVAVIVRNMLQKAGLI
ncbi:fibronectin type III domain-containing protein [Ruminiclostridium cellobioparum]|uniref:fibronectin type III domain-containing protein n=1 Tax=Ruminiclostridium cellobioparum TaxID=29355 RepID=UPI000688228E|nr:S-layer homology domain-containing protein [Ruminiclostridium cellobioparum]